MLQQQQTISFSDYSSLYDLIIPKDNLLRQINDLVDFSFVYQELQDKYCHDNRRTAESPIRMFKYLLLKVIYNVSDVDVVERARYDMSFKYFLGLTPEETNLINPSSLTKFRRLRLKDIELLDLLIKKTVSIAIEVGVLKSKTIIVDATHTLSRSNPISAAKNLEYYCKAVIKVVNSVDDSIELPELPKEKKYSSIMNAAKTIVAVVEADTATANMPATKERLNMLKETISDAETRGVISKDEDARTGHKTADSSFIVVLTHSQRVQLLLCWCTSCSGKRQSRAETSAPPKCATIRVRRPIGFRPPSVEKCWEKRCKNVVLNGNIIGDFAIFDVSVFRRFYYPHPNNLCISVKSVGEYSVINSVSSAYSVEVHSVKPSMKSCFFVPFRRLLEKNAI